MHRILSIGPATTRLAERNRALVKHGYTVHAATTRREALDCAGARQFDVALISDGFPDGYAHDLAHELSARDHGLRLIILPESAATMDDILELLTAQQSRREAA